MPNKDDRELLSLGSELAVMSLQESSTLPATLFQCLIVFANKLDRFSDYLRQKMIDFVWKNNETLKWRVDDPWSDVIACSGPRLSNSRSSSLIYNAVEKHVHNITLFNEKVTPFPASVPPATLLSSNIN